MDLKETVDLFKKRQKLVQGGGEKAVEKQKKLGKLTARELSEIIL